jgi:hypothetical protein
MAAYPGKFLAETRINRYDDSSTPTSIKIDVEEREREVLAQDELFIKRHSDPPMELLFQRELLISRL